MTGLTGRTSRLVVVVGRMAAMALALAATGCGGGGTSLPSWAPADPSPAFLRAAEALVPIDTGPQGDGRLQRALPAAWDLLGSLNDDQLAELRRAKKTGLGVKSLTSDQRSALESFFDTWAREMKGAGSSDMAEDWRAELYRLGASSDLSNVWLTFDVRSGGAVRMVMSVQLPGGGVSPPLPLGMGAKLKQDQ